ncbi:hypothetical protein [Methylorubrum extorquens]|uniref:hypothetical protein n=1 Tax=Methylorubrum extorquens TaxID=408 RepID=UPI0012376811|nr:hypothetical protein [Methylorubrum extorquens]WIU38550.1 hypothetical protein KQ926_18370 [Methylorubrum extorquens]
MASGSDSTVPATATLCGTATRSATTAAVRGHGNGFKLAGRRRGSQSRHGGHTVIRNLSWANKSNGFDDNGAGGGIEPLLVWNNVSCNDARNVDPAMGDPGFAFVFVHHPDTVLGNNVTFAKEERNEILVHQAVELATCATTGARTCSSPRSC